MKETTPIGFKKVDSSMSVRVGLARKKLSKVWLADKLNCSYSYIYQICSGQKDLGINSIIKIAGFLDVPVSEFIKWGETIEK